MKMNFFQRGLGGRGGVFVTLVEITKGLGGHQLPTKMENRGRWWGPKRKSLSSGGSGY